MSSHGFFLKKLILTGEGKPAAELPFSTGLNVISGASDTGKSYVIQCIDYMFGASEPPKSIEEAAGYTAIALSLQAYHGGQVFTLVRSLHGGDFQLFESENTNTSTRPLATKHSAKNDDNISAFFVKLTGLRGRKVRTDLDGKTREASFREISKLVLIDEEQIIKKRSPVLASGQDRSETFETSLFSLLLTGRDDSSVVAQPPAKIRKAQQKAQVELLDQLIASSKSTLSEEPIDPIGVAERLATTKARIDQVSNTISTTRAAINDQEKKRRDAWSARQKLDSRRLVIAELVARFDLLETHYRSDLARMEAVVEAESVLSQLPVERCPLCGAELTSIEEVHRAHAAEEPVEGLRAACETESRKIETLLVDLDSTRGQLIAEGKQLVEDLEIARSSYEAADALLQQELMPRTRFDQEELATLLANRDKLMEMSLKAEQVSSLAQRRDEVVAELTKRRAKRVKRETETSAVDELCGDIQALLKDWRYPGSERVTWNHEKLDILISGKPRASQGKGYRAITYSAFTIGLMNYCQRKRLPHPGLVLLDSPLVTYQEPDGTDDEPLGPDVKDAFFTELAKSPPTQQIIIFENEDPPKSVQTSINYVHFSKAKGVGRYGFLPVVG
jgi:hypothetical protein